MISIIIPNREEPKIQKLIMGVTDIFPEAEVIICTDRYGKGKGWAIREALKEAKGDIIGFIDGDLDIEPRMFLRLFPFLKDYDIVVGSKIVRGSIGRRWLTRLSRIYLHIFFGFDYDTQTGIKLFHRYALLDWKTNGFMYDLEILWKARQKGLQIIQVPVEVTNYGKSAKPMRFGNVWRSLVETLKIRSS